MYVYRAWMYIGSRIRIYVHIILYTYTVCHCTASSPRSLGGRTSAERLITFGDRRNYNIVLSPPFSWTSIVLSQGRS